MPASGIVQRIEVMIIIKEEVGHGFCEVYINYYRGTSYR